MSYNELRKDYFVDRWVVIATERARRPIDLIKPKAPPTQNLATCPLCPGNERLTPPAVLAYLPGANGEVIKDKEEGDFRFKNCLIRCVPNMYPAFTPPKNANEKIDILNSDTFGYAVGYHEVLIESRVHNDQPATAELSSVVNLINAYKDRLFDLSQKPYVAHVQIFRNHGIEAGASQSHAHSQIITTPFIPTNVIQELAASKTYWQAHKQCLLCVVAKEEAKTDRFILDNEHFVVIAPYASINPMEFWIIPKRHSPNFLDLTQAETEAFAKTLKTALKALKDLVNDPPYNYGFHLALNKDAQDYYHWHLEVYPTLSIWAGFEKSTGMYINTIKPETAAAELKQAITD